MWELPKLELKREQWNCKVPRTCKKSVNSAALKLKSAMSVQS